MNRFPFRRFLGRAAAAATALAVLAASGSAMAAQACYNTAELDAEIALRLHTELMVVGLTCNKLDPSRNFFAKYQEFTTKHRAVLLDYEGRLVSHFKRVDKGGERQFHTFRTEIANEVGKRAALVTAVPYCAFGRKLVDQMMGMDGPAFRKAVTEAAAQPDRLASRPLCEVMDAQAKAAKAAKKVAGAGKKTPAKKAAKPAAAAN